MECAPTCTVLGSVQPCSSLWPGDQSSRRTLPTPCEPPTSAPQPPIQRTPTGRKKKRELLLENGRPGSTAEHGAPGGSSEGEPAPTERPANPARKRAVRKVEKTYARRASQPPGGLRSFAARRRERRVANGHCKPSAHKGAKGPVKKSTRPHCCLPSSNSPSTEAMPSAAPQNSRRAQANSQRAVPYPPHPPHSTLSVRGAAGLTKYELPLQTLDSKNDAATQAGPLEVRPSGSQKKWESHEENEHFEIMRESSNTSKLSLEAMPCPPQRSRKFDESESTSCL